AATTKNISDLELILNDLMLNSKIAESSHLAKAIQTQIVKSLCKKYKNVKDMGVKQAPFYVLIGANMPSILLETAFISNKTEEARMRSNRYMEQMANGIVEGIKSYIKSVKTAELTL
ncbi:MAG: N-acetylmuramoyl-L-alanine amidase, partial [Deltaproteobacteria bacterium]|nr:N-acetylmuramoyl-L-alanine amidase [Deltaproteobacteria bacterium]